MKRTPSNTSPVTGLVHILHLPLVLNQEVVLLAKFTTQSMLDAVVKYACEELWLVPRKSTSNSIPSPILLPTSRDKASDTPSTDTPSTDTLPTNPRLTTALLIRLLRDALVPHYNLSHILQFNTGAAPLAPGTIKELETRFPHTAIRQAWGMTESCSCLTLTPPGHQSYANAHTVGKIVPGTVLKIVDVESRQEVPCGVAGEILARGPQVAMGYLQADGSAARITDAEGYLHTGDLGSVSAAGFVTIHDRLKELIKVKGVGVAPAELEDVLLGHPDIHDAAVVGKPDEYAGEVAKAFVVLRAGARTTETDVQGFVKQRKARAKWLTGGVEFVEEIPKSAAGKILRRVLRDREKIASERRSKL